MNKYTPEEISEITAREKKCLEFLKENSMSPAAVIQKVRLDIKGVDVYADQVTPYLADFKYNENESPKKDK